LPTAHGGSWEAREGNGSLKRNQEGTLPKKPPKLTTELFLDGGFNFGERGEEGRGGRRKGKEEKDVGRKGEGRHERADLIKTTEKRDDKLLDGILSRCNGLDFAAGKDDWRLGRTGILNCLATLDGGYCCWE
jgi:hypothetical protein